MTRYLVIRTDKQRAQFIAKELEQGRLRQGWGWKPEQNLRSIRVKLDAGSALTQEEAAAWRNRRLLDTEWNGLKPGDTVIIPNQPRQGCWLLARVVGPYRYEQPQPDALAGTDYSHVVPVELVRTKDGRPAVVEADNVHVDARLRASMRSMSRMWSLDAQGDKIERLISAIALGEDTSVPQPEELKFGALSAEIVEAAWLGIRARYKGAEFERLVLRVLGAVYPEVQHRGGPGEKGADIIAVAHDSLGMEYKIAVQVKLHEGEERDPHSLDQIERARIAHRVDAGIVVTTATGFSADYLDYHAELEARLGIDVKLMNRSEFVRLLLAHLGSPSQER